MARMYTRLVVMPKKNVAKAFLHMFCSEMVILFSFFFNFVICDFTPVISKQRQILPLVY